MLPALKPKEHEIQAVIVDALKWAGFTVYQTSAFRQKGPSGVSRGVPDLLVPIPGITGCMLGLEVKKPGRPKWSSNEQQEAHLMGHFYLVQSLEDVASALDAVQERLPSRTLSHMATRFRGYAKAATRG